jgi:hypothetical protein
MPIENSMQKMCGNLGTEPHSQRKREPESSFLYLNEVNLCSKAHKPSNLSASCLRSPSCTSTAPPSPVSVNTPTLLIDEIDHIRSMLNEGTDEKTILRGMFESIKSNQNKEPINALVEAAFNEYRTLKGSDENPMEIPLVPGLFEFIKNLPSGISIEVCTNASPDKVKRELKTSYEEIWSINGKCGKGHQLKKGEKQAKAAADAEAMIKKIEAAHRGKKIIVVGNEMTDALFAKDLQDAGVETYGFLIGPGKRNTDLLGASKVIENYEEAFTAIQEKITELGAENVVLLMDAHGTILDTAALLQQAANSVIEKQD